MKPLTLEETRLKEEMKEQLDFYLNLVEVICNARQ